MYHIYKHFYLVPKHSLFLEFYNKITPTSFPLDLMKSISSVLNVAIDMLLTLCGGVKPRLKNEYILF